MRIRRKEKQRPGMAGKIKIGEKTEDGRPRSLDYFVATGFFEKRFKDVLGKPNSLRIRIPDIENCLDIRYELRKGKKKVAISDGENVWTYNRETGDKVLQEKTFDVLKESFENSAGQKWCEVLRLAFFVPETDIVGLWVFETKASKSTIKNIENYFDSLKHLNLPLSQLTYILSVKKVTSQILEKAKFPVVDIVADLAETKNYEIGAHNGLQQIQE